MAQQTLVALFHSMEDADAARRQLAAAGIPAADMHLQKGPVETAAATRGEPARHEVTFFQWLFGARPSDADIERYRSHVAKGGAALTVRADNRDTNRLSGLLKQHNLVAIEGAQEHVTSAASSAGSSGAHGTAAGKEATTAQGAAATRGATTSTSQGTTAKGATSPAAQGAATPQETVSPAGYGAAAAKGTTSPTAPGSAQGTTPGAAAMKGATPAQGAAATEETTLPTAHEELTVGKRQVSEAKTYRIRRYVVERPAEQRVSLHEETVEIERHAAPDGGSGEQPFEERTIEYTEMHEEPVISKRVVADEEVRVRKKGMDRIETVRGTVRESRVEVDHAVAGDKPQASSVPPSGKR